MVQKYIIFANYIFHLLVGMRKTQSIKNVLWYVISKYARHTVEQCGYSCGILKRGRQDSTDFFIPMHVCTQRIFFISCKIFWFRDFKNQNFLLYRVNSAAKYKLKINEIMFLLEYSRRKRYYKQQKFSKNEYLTDLPHHTIKFYTCHYGNLRHTVENLLLFIIVSLVFIIKGVKMT